MKRKLFFLSLAFCLGTYSYGQNWQELFNKAQEYDKAGDLNQTVFISEKALNQAEKEFGKISRQYRISLDLYARNQIQQAKNEFGSGNIYRFHVLSEVVSLYQEVDQVIKPDITKKENEPSVNKNTLLDGIELYISGRYCEASLILSSFIPIVREIVSVRDTNYLAKLLIASEDSYCKCGQYEMAEPLMREAIQIVKASLGENHRDYGRALFKLAILYDKMGQYEEAEPLIKEAIRIIKTSLGENHHEYGGALNNLAMLYKKMGRYEEAEPLMKEAILIAKASMGELHPDYSTSLSSLAQLYLAMGHYEEAEPLIKEAVRIDKASLVDNHPDFARDLNILAQLYEAKGRYQEAEPLMKEAMRIDKASLGENHTSFGRDLNNLAMLYKDISRYDEAEQLMKEAIRIAKSSVEDNYPDYGTYLNNMAQLYLAMGRYEEAEQLMKESIRIYEASKVYSQPDYLKDINNLAAIYQVMGRYKEAEPLMREIIGIAKESLGENHPDYRTYLSNLSVLYTKMGWYEQAEPLMRDVIRIAKSNTGENHSSYARDLNNLAMLYEKIVRYDEAEQFMKEAVRIYKASLGEYHPEYGMSLNNLAGLYNDMGCYEKAEQLMMEALRIDKVSLGENHPDYGRDLNNLAQIYKVMGRYKEADLLMKEAYLNLKYNLQKNSGYLSEAEMHQFIETLFYNLNLYQSFNYYRSNSDFENGGFAMDIELYQKGLLLRSVVSTRKRIMESGDTALIRSYQKMLMYRKQADYIYTLSPDKRFDNPAILEVRANELEKELRLRLKEYRLSLEEAEIVWKQIQEKLNADEAVIEFASFDYHNRHWTDSTLYCALVLRKEYKYPKLIYLFEQKKLEDLGEMGSAAYFENEETKLYDLIWHPIDSLLNGIKTIYYSPSGLLHKISFAAIRMKGGRYLSDQYVLRTLSSTHNLAIEKQHYTLTQGQKVVLFGGIDYWADTTSLKNTAMAYHPDEELVSAQSNPLKGGNKLKSEWDSLPDTRKEVEIVAGYLTKKGINIVKYTGNGAIEERVKNLSNHSPDILFISTHGFALKQDTTVSKAERLRMLELLDNPLMKKIKYYDNPLLRSGLIMAGANHAWKEGKAIQGVDDGILTAKEISLLNLGNTKLAVLSACETALGDLSGSEGVYGLQRALFMAGVKNIIVSLWSVPSKETEEMMILFYENLLSGKTLNDAFYTTQQIMKQKYRDDPKSWAGFVLIE
jgi:tetratricopeptide (TPR) repeat protein/CHAT domain-containing protein